MTKGRAGRIEKGKGRRAREERVEKGPFGAEFLVEETEGFLDVCIGGPWGKSDLIIKFGEREDFCGEIQFHQDVEGGGLEPSSLAGKGIQFA